MLMWKCNTKLGI